MASLCPSKVLTTFSQVDLLLSFILFLVENLVPYPDVMVHVTILVSASLSVLLSLMEMIFISKSKYWQLLGATAFRLGPMAAISIFWMIRSNKRTTYLSVGGLSLGFQVLKGLCLLVACISGINAVNQKRKEKYQEFPPAQQKDAMAITIQITPASGGDGVDPDVAVNNLNKNCWDPLEPAYDSLGNLRPGGPTVL